YALALLTACANSASIRVSSVGSTAGFGFVLGVDFFFGSLVLAFAFFIPVLSNQLGVMVRRRFTTRANYDFVARTSGDGPGASSVRAFLNPASSSQRLISLKENVSPLSVLTSMLTANIKPFSGSVRSSLTSHSP